MNVCMYICIAADRCDVYMYSGGPLLNAITHAQSNMSGWPLSKSNAYIRAYIIAADRCQVHEPTLHA